MHQLVSLLFLSIFLTHCSRTKNLNQDDSITLPLSSPLAHIEKLKASSPYATSTLTNTAVITEKIEDSNDFSLSFMRAVVKADPHTNFVFSPLSLQAAFSLVEPGVQSSAAINALKKAFHIKPGVTTRQALHDNLMQLQKRMVESQLIIANDIWIDRSLKDQVNMNYLETIQTHFNADLKLVDFINATTQVVTAINDHIKTNTKGLIPRMLNEQDLSKFTRFIITNTLYFKGQWATKFAAPKPADFTTEAGQVQKVQMLTRQEQSLEYYEDAKVQIALKRYSDLNSGMLIFLPKKGHSVSDIIAMIKDHKNLRSYMGKLKDTPVHLSLPAFDFSYRVPQMDQIIFDLGGKALFAENLHIFNNNPVTIDKAIHQAKIIVTEEGTEAAAATAIIGITSIYQPADLNYVAMKVDRPALFLLVDTESSQILFCGKLADPS